MQGLADRLGGFLGAQESGDQELACGLEVRMMGRPVARRRSNISRVLRFRSVTGIGEYLARVDRRPVDQPRRHHPYVQDFVRPIDAGAQEVLLLAVCVAARTWGSRSVGGSMPTPSGLIRRRENARTARIRVALGSPTPSNPLRSSARTPDRCSPMTRTSLPARS
jgi:hypothetical protein